MKYYLWLVFVETIYYSLIAGSDLNNDYLPAKASSTYFSGEYL